MASVLARVSRRTCRDLSRTLQIAWPTAIVQRSFLTSSFNVQRVSHPSFGAQRFESALATARQGPLVGDEVEETTSKEELPHFMTLEGSISPLTLKALTQTPMKLTHMSPVQATVFPLLPQLAEPYDPFPSDNAARDLLVKARTGTGKTLGFLLPAVEARLKAIEAHGKQAVLDAGLKSDKTLEMRAQRAYAHKNLGTLIISPTRELATQIAVEAQKLTSHIEGFTVNLFVGGAPKGPQMRGWTRGRRDILVATPGRLRDFLVSEPEVASGLAKTQVFILDEADTLLDMGFRPDIDAIGDSLPPTPERQTFMFSATVSQGVEQVAKRMLAPNHRFINCVPADSSPVHAHVPQYHTVLQNASLQIPHIVRLLAHDQLVNPGASKVILFLPTTKMTQLFATAIRELAKNSLPAGRNTSIYEIHSKRTMDARTSTSNRFRSDKSGASILITSDVSARGVDYPNVTRVIQVGIPSSPDQYIHRVGRTGRAGTKGRGDLVLLPFELQYLTTALSHLPLVPLRHNSLTEETLVLAKKFDEDPQAFFANAPWTSSTAPRIGPSRDRRLPVTGPSMFQTPLVGTLEALENNVTQLVSRFDEDGVNETFLSLIGYYASQSIDMRITRESLVEGLKAWTVDACGLPMPPFISPSFLQKIGLADSTGRDARRRRHPRDPRSSMRDTRRRESKDFAYGTKDEKESQRADWGEDGFGPDRGRYGQGGRGGYGQDSRGGYSQGSRGGYGQGSRGGYSQRGHGGYQRGRGDGQDGRGGYREGGRGDGQGSRHRDAGESGYGLKR